MKTVEVTSPVAEAEVGQQLKSTAVAKDESGKTLDVKPAVWFAAPFDVVSADNSGLWVKIGKPKQKGFDDGAGRLMP